MRLLHFIDATSALNIILKGASRQSDMNSLVGFLWYTLCERRASYWARHVGSAQNLADGPSRGNFQLMTVLSAQEVITPFPAVDQALDLFEQPIVPYKLVQ
jgi:hypothetical protein